MSHKDKTETTTDKYKLLAGIAVSFLLSASFVDVGYGIGTVAMGFIEHSSFSDGQIQIYNPDDQKIILDRPTLETITQRYAVRGRAMTPAAERQGLVLEGATVLPNSVGAAPGQRIDLPAGRFLFVLPGPPGEFNAILNEEIIPWLKQRFPDARPRPIRTVHTKGIGESDMVTLLENAAFQPTQVDLGFYPGKGRVQIRLAADPGRESEVDAAEQILRNLLADFLDTTL